MTKPKAKPEPPVMPEILEIDEATLALMNATAPVPEED